MRVQHTLLAEDPPGDVLLVRESLQEHQIAHELHVVQDGQQALDYVRRVGKAGEPPCPDLMLLGLNLPEGNQHFVLTGFRKHPECAGVPVIVVTSSDSPKDRERKARLSTDYYFRKLTEYDGYRQLGASYTRCSNSTQRKPCAGLMWGITSG